MYTAPPPPEPPVLPHAPEHSTPSITSLVPLIISSPDSLLFISHSIGGSQRKLRLVCVAFQDSVALYPSCFHDGCFLIDFYTAHPSNICYNAINQQFWLQYCDQTPAVFGTMDAHLITLFDTSKDRAKRHHPVPDWAWANLTHSDTYIHGPFEFVLVRGRKTCNHVSQEDWDVLARSKSMFSDPSPHFNIPPYSIYFDRGIHTILSNAITISLVPHGD